jgi:hypothetical protein
LARVRMSLRGPHSRHQAHPADARLHGRSMGAATPDHMHLGNSTFPGDLPATWVGAALAAAASGSCSELETRPVTPGPRAPWPRAPATATAAPPARPAAPPGRDSRGPSPTAIAAQAAAGVAAFKLRVARFLVGTSHSESAMPGPAQPPSRARACALWPRLQVAWALAAPGRRLVCPRLGGDVRVSRSSVYYTLAARELW